MKIIALFFAMFLTGKSCAQLFEDLNKIQSVYYASASQMEFNFKYKIYEHLDKKHLLDTLSGTYVLSNGNFVFKAGKYTLYKNERYFVKVDPTEKSITVFPPGEKMNTDLFTGLDTLFKAEGVEVRLLKTVDERVKTYRLSQPYGNLADSVEITFNKSTYVIEKLFVYLKFNPLEDNFADDEIKKPVLEGKFYDHRIQKSSENKSSIFKDNPYFNELSNGNLVLKEKYKGYTILNRLK